MSDDDVMLRPVVAYAVGIMSDGIALQLDASNTEKQLAMGEGDPYAFALTAQGAIDLGQALIERGELAKRSTEEPIN